MVKIELINVLSDTLTEMDNYFPGAFFTLVPFNPNPGIMDPHGSELKPGRKHRHSGKVSATGWD